ncbi:helix-loop-helix DNA-binding domain-containing protein [Podospora conica]|nr:helix-loop-helix DNA-binding domain-containing protein [Schizothecium conicum]
MDSSNWDLPDHAMHSAPPTDDDFQHFLNMSAMNSMDDHPDYGFHDFHSAAAGVGPSHLLQQPRDQLDTAMSGTDAPMILSRAHSSLHQQISAITSAAPYQSIPTSLMPAPSPSEAMVNSLDAQIHFLQQQKLQAQQRQLEEQMEEQQAAFFARQSRMVPPTPQSLEIPARVNQYYGQPSPAGHQQQQMDFHYRRAKEQQEMFTPLVSPAVTPLETHFSMDTQFTVPGAYFSPLTSPALHAQNDALAMFESRLGTLTTSSPVEMDTTLPNPALPESAAKKARKAAAKPRSKPGVKQSPISKPLRRKTATTPNLNAQVLIELVENAEQRQDSQHQRTPLIQTSSSSSAGITDSENGSISPEALNDLPPIEMPPPPIPKPRSTRPSPFIAPISNPILAVNAGAPSPATPASLMKLASPSNRTAPVPAGTQEPVATEHIEVFELPESANFVNSHNNLPDTSHTLTPTLTTTDSNAATPTTKTPGLAPLPSPAFSKLPPSATGQSPLLLPGSSRLKTTPQLLPRNATSHNPKKRGSVSSVQVSPALRPKISPNIMPLLPGDGTGASTLDSTSHLLATKSNYQRLLEGNTVPGVSYPSELSTNLTSKRTSHKIAEQGRRNRINSALQEMAGLLPKGMVAGASGGEEEEGKKGAGGAGPNSKASTVEMAIEYIRQLQREVREAERRAEEAEGRLKGEAEAEAEGG